MTHAKRLKVLSERLKTRKHFHPFQIFWGANDNILDQVDNNYETEVDTELLGGAVLAFTIISPMLLLAYALEGVEVIQRTSMDILFSTVGGIVLIAVGGELGEVLIGLILALDKFRSFAYWHNQYVKYKSS